MLNSIMFSECLVFVLLLALADASVTPCDVVVYAPHKSGSMFIHHYFQEFANVSNFEHFSENYDPERNSDAFISSTAPRKIMAPIRAQPGKLSVNENSRVVVHYRDPRDVIVSSYYSFGYSHVAPPVTSPNYEGFMNMKKHVQSFTLDKYVIESDLPVSKNRTYVSLYDKMMNNFSDWSNDLCRFVQLPSEMCPKIYDKAKHHTASAREKPLDVTHIDFQKKGSSRAAHVRDGKSGQYLSLQPETLRKVDKVVGPALMELTKLLELYSTVPFLKINPQ